MLTPEQLQRFTPSQTVALPKVRQLYLSLYRAIISGELPSGFTLPASRELASQLTLGRNTVISVYNQLCDEGLLRSNGRQGTTVSYDTPAPMPHSAAQWKLSHRSQTFNKNRHRPDVFSPGEPDTSLFPRQAWKNALQKAARLPPSALGYQDSSLPQLQQAIARYLATYRSLQVQPEQIVITSSTRQSLLLATVLFCDEGDTVWMETPGYSGAVDAFTHLGLKLQPCAVDKQGLVLPKTKTLPAIIYTTPCFQYPYGVALSPVRREQLLAISREHGSVLFEDDYDSEFRDDSQPRPALAANDSDARVVHAGTFSKLMFPAVRVAWLVVPQKHAITAHHCLRSLGGGHNTIPQAAVAELLDNGTLTKHLQRARQVYSQRRKVLLTHLPECNSVRTPSNPVGSFNLVLSLRNPCTISSLEQQLHNHGVGAVPLERMKWNQPRARLCRKIVVGLGGTESLEIPAKLADLDSAISKSG